MPWDGEDHPFFGKNVSLSSWESKSPCLGFLTHPSFTWVSLMHFGGGASGNYSHSRGRRQTILPHATDFSSRSGKLAELSFLHVFGCCVCVIPSGIHIFHSLMPMDLSCDPHSHFGSSLCFPWGWEVVL